MSESEYKALVLAEYDRQVSEHQLRSELLIPTPANIKAEIVKICEQGEELSAGDKNILSSFVGERKDTAEYRKAFQIGKADPFRQAVKLLEDRTINTNIKYVNLLALLIGFKPRPYHPNLQIKSASGPRAKPETTQGYTDSPPGSSDPKHDLVATGGQKRNGNSYSLLWIFAAVIIAGMSWYLVAKKTVRPCTGKEGCMIWNDDHYECIECNDQSTSTPHYPINHQLIDNFKRITRPDTLTYNSVRKVWYSNYKGSVEFYTDSGPNPLDTNLRVLIMTPHIFEKYVLHMTN